MAVFDPSMMNKASYAPQTPSNPYFLPLLDFFLNPKWNDYLNHDLRRCWGYAGRSFAGGRESDGRRWFLQRESDCETDRATEERVSERENDGEEEEVKRRGSTRDERKKRGKLYKKISTKWSRAWSNFLIGLLASTFVDADNPLHVYIFFTRVLASTKYIFSDDFSKSTLIILYIYIYIFFFISVLASTLVDADSPIFLFLIRV